MFQSTIPALQGRHSLQLVELCAVNTCNTSTCSTQTQNCCSPTPREVAGPVVPYCQGKSLDHLSRIVRESGKQHNIYFQIATENHDVGAMESAHVCTDRQRDQVATQMSHSRQTQELHYIRMKSQAEACEGYKILANLRQGAGLGWVKESVPLPMMKLKLLNSTLIVTLYCCS